jgi:hypothetical protein
MDYIERLERENQGQAEHIAVLQQDVYAFQWLWLLGVCYVGALIGGVWGGLLTVAAIYLDIEGILGRALKYCGLVPKR